MAERLEQPVPSADGKTRSSRDDVLSFLDSLDSYSNPPLTSSNKPISPSPESTTVPTTTLPVPNSEDAQSVLDFLDEITQRSSAPTPPINTKPTSRSSILSGNTAASGQTTTPRRSGESIRSLKSGGGINSTSISTSTSVDPILPEVSIESIPAPSSTQAPSDGGWGWTSVWHQATNVVQQASQVAQQVRSVAEEQVKTAQTNAAGLGGMSGISEGFMKVLGENEQAKKVMEYARGAQLDQLGKDLKSTTLKSLTDLLNAVAPPIAEHEIIQVSLSHDMVGYDGVETLVYRGLSKIMDQIDGGTLIVNKGNEERPRDTLPVDSEERQLNAVEGLAEGWKLAEANLDVLVKNSFKSAPKEVNEDSLTIPVTNCPIYIRIQPCLAPLPAYTPSSLLTGTETSPTNSPLTTESKSGSIALFFLLLLRDPTHNIVQSSMSQSIPAAWLEIPFEENEWVEDIMVDVLRSSIQTIGQEYITHRTRALGDAVAEVRAAALSQLSPEQKDQQELDSADAVATSRVL